MTSIILELQSLAANPNSDVEELVSKTLMVARKLKINELTEKIKKGEIKVESYPGFKVE